MVLYHQSDHNLWTIKMHDPTIASRLTTLLERIRAAEQCYQRIPGSVTLLAVSKGQSVQAIEEAIAAGQRAFGENYLQEALTKMAVLTNPDLEWHFIGTIQRNKTKAIASHFNWVHSVSRLDIAQRLNDQRPDHLLPLNICIQVNSSRDPHKDGIDLDQLSPLTLAIANLPRLTLRGLMTIPEQSNDFEQQRLPFKLLAEAFEQLRRKGILLDTLSMGMSDDFEAAIAEGATLLRIGRALFGPRGL